MEIASLKKISWGVCLLAAVSTSACNQDGKVSLDADSSSQAAGGGLTGNISADGSSTVYPFSVAAADAFLQEYPDVKPAIGVSGTGAGFKRFSTGEIDISNASRPIKKEEIARCMENGIEFVEIPVAYDGLTIVVHPSNDWVDQLTVDQLKQIYLAGGVRRWNELQPDWPDEEIVIFSPGTDSGTFDYFKEVVAGEEGAIRADLTASEDDNVLVTGVSGEPNSIGYFGASYYFNNQNKLRAVPIVNPQTEQAVLPDPGTIRSGEYAPFSRPLFIYINFKSLRRPEIKRFASYQLENAAQFAQEVQYVPLQDEVYAAAKDHLTNRLTGTHFLTADGKKREGSLQEIYREENLVPSVPQ